MNSDLVASDFVPAKEEGNAVPLCWAKPTPSFINLQASSPPATCLKIPATKLSSGKEGCRVDFPNGLSRGKGYMEEVAGAGWKFYCLLVMLVEKWPGKEIITVSSVSLHFSYLSSHGEISGYLAYLWEAKQHTRQSWVLFLRTSEFNKEVKTNKYTNNG